MAVIDATYAQLNTWLGEGTIQEHCNTGDILNVTYDEADYSSYSMPFEITGFRNRICRIEGEDKLVKAINVLAYKATSLSQKTSWAVAASGSPTFYSNSTLRTALTTTYQESLDPSFVAYLGATKVQTLNRNGATDIVYDKIYAPSLAELGVVDSEFASPEQNAIEGPAFTSYQGANAEARVREVVRGLLLDPVPYWTRTYGQTGTSVANSIQESGTPLSVGYGSTLCMVVAADFIGDGYPVETPASKGNILVPINGIAKKASKILVSQNGVAKYATKCYVSQTGVTKLAWEAGGRV